MLSDVLLNILIEKPVIDTLHKYIVIKVTIQYEGNTFEGIGSSDYEEDYEIPDAIKDAQEEAIKIAKKLAGIKLC